SANYPEARVHSLEPQQVPFEILTRNTSFYPNTKVFNAGLFDSDRGSTRYLSWVASATALIGSSRLKTEKTETIKLRDAAG
ncbi:MAG: hypothetical protein RL326_1007, partial [Pseudomonadota bacterium]